MNPLTRRTWLTRSALATAALASDRLASGQDDVPANTNPRFRLAVQQYSFNRQLRSGELDILDFPLTVVDGTGIRQLEFYNGHFMNLANDGDFFREIRRRMDDLGASATLILLRSENPLDSPEPLVRLRAVEELKPWMEAIRVLGGTAIRVDLRSGGAWEENLRHASDGLGACAAAAGRMGLDVIVENHGGNSSNGKWIRALMDKVRADNVGTLPDFQNFGDYNPYVGVQEMLPRAKFICAKSKAFDEDGNETNVDYGRLLRSIANSEFHGTIGIEFEGHEIPPVEGIRLTRSLIERHLGPANVGV